MNTTVSPLRESARTVQLSSFQPDELFFSITDDKGVIAHANSVFTRLSGYTFDEMKGQPHNIVRDPAMPRGAFRLIWDELQAGRPVASYVANLSSDDERYEVFAVMLPTENGHISIRVRPETGGMRDKIFEIFDRTREFEATVEGGARQQADAGAEFLRTELAAIGFADMGTLTRALLPREVAAMIESVDELEQTASRVPLEILPGKIRMLGRLLLNPLHSLERVEEVSRGLHEQVTSGKVRSAAIPALATIVKEATEAIAWGGADQAGLGKDLTEAAQEALERLGGAGMEFKRAVEAAVSLHEMVEALEQNIGIFALQNQMIGRFALELLGGEAAEPPGQSMRLLHHALDRHFQSMLDAIDAVNELAQSAPERFAAVLRHLDGLSRPLQAWGDLAAKALAAQGAEASPELVAKVQAVRGAVHEGFAPSPEILGYIDELKNVNVTVEDLPMRATIKFIGMVTAEIE